MMTDKKRSAAAKLGWERRRRRAKERAEIEARIPAARKRVEEFKKKGLDALLVGDQVYVVTSCVAPYSCYMVSDDWILET